MAFGPDPPPPAEQSGQERVGPLSLLRTVKADGRALLLYSHDEAPAEAVADQHQPPGSAGDRA